MSYLLSAAIQGRVWSVDPGDEPPATLDSGRESDAEPIDHPNGAAVCRQGQSSASKEWSIGDPDSGRPLDQDEGLMHEILRLDLKCSKPGVPGCKRLFLRAGKCFLVVDSGRNIWSHWPTYRNAPSFEVRHMWGRLDNRPGIQKYKKDGTFSDQGIFLLDIRIRTFEHPSNSKLQHNHSTTNNKSPIWRLQSPPSRWLWSLRRPAVLLSTRRLMSRSPVPMRSSSTSSSLVSATPIFTP